MLRLRKLLMNAVSLALMPSFETLESLVQKLNASGSVKAQLKGERRAIRFMVDSDSFLLLLKEDGSAELMRESDTPPTVTLTASDAVMEDILGGRLNGVQAFLTGRLRIGGDIVAAQKLVSVLEKTK